VPRYVLIDEIHLLLSVSRELDDRSVAAIRRRLNSAPFAADLRRLLRQRLRRDPPLHAVRLRLTR
jgi:hypothetical protein